MRLRGRMAVVVALLGLAGASSAVAPAHEPQEDDYPYIKVEMNGRFRREGPPHRVQNAPTLVVGSHTFELDIEWPKGVAVDKEMEKLDGETVIVHGTLQLRRPHESRDLVWVTRFVVQKANP